MSKGLCVQVSVLFIVVCNSVFVYKGLCVKGSVCKSVFE